MRGGDKVCKSLENALIVRCQIKSLSFQFCHKLKTQNQTKKKKKKKKKSQVRQKQKKKEFCVVSQP